MKKILYPFFVFACSSLFAQPGSTEPLRKKCFVLNRFLLQQHYQPLNWTDSTATIFFNRWLNRLDEDKLYFTKEDINQLTALRSKLAGEMQGNGQNFFEGSVRLYRKRLVQSDSLIRVILSKPVDFTKPDKLLWTPADFSSNTEWTARWLKIVKWKILDKIDDLTGDSTGSLSMKVPANFPVLEKMAREKLLKQHNTRMKTKLLPAADFEKDFEEDYLNTIAECYDPHTNYMSMSVKKAFETDLSGFEFSTGLDVKKNDKAEWEVGRLVPGGAAWRNGELHAGDVLLKIKTGNQPEAEIADMSEAQVQAFLQGSSDENLVLTIRQKSGVQKTITLVKEKTADDEEIVKGSILNKGGKKIGYILLPDFYSQADEETENLEGCANDVAKEVLKLKKEGIQGLIIDLRNNGGGSMWEAIQLAGIFINEGVLGSYKEKGGKVHYMKDPNRGTIYEGPLLLMVNGGSASASELLSAVLQDYNRALIVGGTTYGKGTAQVILPVDTLSAPGQKTEAADFVKVTSGKFYRVDGSTTQWKGVVPDILLPDIYLSEKLKEKGDITALKPDLSKKAIYTPLSPLPVTALSTLSNKRISADSAFAMVQQFAAWFKKNMEGTEIPLHWTGFAAWSNQTKKLYASWEAVEERNEQLLSANNTEFDKQRIKMQPEVNQQANKIRLADIAADIFIHECVNIMQDWLKLKN